MTRHLMQAICFIFVAYTAAFAQDRDTKVRNDRERFLDSDFWIYNDLAAAKRSARLLNKPLLVVLRCIP